MDYNKSKYTTMPENSYFDRRMANGDELSDIFDHVNKYGHPFSDKGCPILVQVGKLYNYVLNNFILFDSWFVIANEFGSAKWSYAYRRLNEKGIREGGVLFRLDGFYITREEFLDIWSYDAQYEEKVVVRQYNGLFNIININNGTKIDNTGINVDYIDSCHPTSSFYRVAKGGELTRNEEDMMWSAIHGEEIARKNNIKCNLYHIEKGYISPSLWFDFVDSFIYVPIPYSRNRSLCNHTIVHLNGKKNLMDQNGHLLSDKWFDVCHLHYDGTGDAGILKSESLKSLPSEIGDNYDYNPQKFYLYEIDRNGMIKPV